MLRTNENIAKIELLLGIYESYIKFQNSRGYNDINKDCEDVFCTLLNRIYNYELKNVNSYKKPNTPAIDLLDEKNRVFFQITSNNDMKKITKTKEMFEKNFPEFKNEDISILILGTKKNHKSSIDRVSLVDFKDLITEINSRKDEKLCKDVVNILTYQLNLEKIIGDGVIELKENTKCIPAKNYKKFIDWFYDYDVKNIKEDEKNSLVKDLKDFIEELRGIPVKVRKMITVAVTNCIYEDNLTSNNERIYFDLNQLYLRYGDFNLVEPLISVLKNKKQIYIYSDDDNEYHMYGYFSFKAKYCKIDCLYLVYHFCQSESVDIEKILVEMCFEYFDE